MCLLFLLRSAASIPGYSPQWNVRTAVMRGAFRQLPLIDRHIQLPFRPLLYSTPPTSVTLTVKAHLSICWSNCSPGWLAFRRRRRPVHRTHTRTGEARRVRDQTSGPFVNFVMKQQNEWCSGKLTRSPRVCLCVWMRDVCSVTEVWLNSLRHSVWPSHCAGEDCDHTFPW